MKFSWVTITSLCMLLMLIAISCHPGSSKGRTITYFNDAQNLARITGGFYLKDCTINVSKDTERNQNCLHLMITRSHMKPREINVFLDENTWNTLVLPSGKYEALFLKNILLVNNTGSGKNYVFKVDNEELSTVLSKLPPNYLPENAYGAIGISSHKNAGRNL